METYHTEGTGWDRGWVHTVHWFTVRLVRHIDIVCLRLLILSFLQNRKLCKIHAGKMTCMFQCVGQSFYFNLLLTTGIPCILVSSFYLCLFLLLHLAFLVSLWIQIILNIKERVSVVTWKASLVTSINVLFCYIVGTTLINVLFCCIVGTNVVLFQDYLHFFSISSSSSRRETTSLGLSMSVL